jgi:hypothetical protein
VLTTTGDESVVKVSEGKVSYLQSAPKIYYHSEIIII